MKSPPVVAMPLLLLLFRDLIICESWGVLINQSVHLKVCENLFSQIKSSVNRNPDINVKIPFFVVGELINNLIREIYDQRRRVDFMAAFF